MFDESLMRLRDVERAVGFKKSAIYDRMSRGVFPLAVRVGGANRWPSSAIRQYIHDALNGKYAEYRNR